MNEQTTTNPLHAAIADLSGEVVALVRPGEDVREAEEAAATSPDLDRLGQGRTSAGAGETALARGVVELRAALDGCSAEWSHETFSRLLGAARSVVDAHGVALGEGVNNG
jgi:hypothetical protein